MAGRDLTRNAEESEKAIESYLVTLTKRAGGMPLKFSSATQTGYPDRLLLFPGGRQIWVEVKSKGRHPTRLQATRIRALRDIGHRVEICDSRARAAEIIRTITDKEQGDEI